MKRKQELFSLNQCPCLLFSIEGWSPEKNPVSKINSWKQKLNIQQIKTIESQEYQSELYRQVKNLNIKHVQDFFN